MEGKKIFVTGIAGFIGYSLAKKMVQVGYSIVGIDNLNDYYDVELKTARLADLGLMGPFKDHSIVESTMGNVVFYKADLTDNEFLNHLFNVYQISTVVNLAAQAGVRYSLINPQTYIYSNISGLVSLLEACKNNNIKRVFYASSSSVYGSRFQGPFSEDNNTDFPISLYAATKKANEVIAHSYSSLYNIQTIGLRFFTVYGPWGRPDMAPMKFLKKMLNGEKIEIYNNGQMTRDFTYIDDVVEILKRLIISDLTFVEQYNIYNIGSSRPTKLMDFINTLEKVTKITAKKAFLEMQLGDVELTHSDSLNVLNLIDEPWFNFHPLDKGLQELFNWYLSAPNTKTS